jgi:hypothetical protein
MYAIVEKIENSGSYTWTPSTDLEDDTTHYGIEIIDDATGQYQYSTQFGISNPSYSSAASSSAATYATSSAPIEVKDSTKTSSADDDYSINYSTTYSTMTSCDCDSSTIAATATATGASTVSTGSPAAATPATTVAPGSGSTGSAGSAPAGSDYPSNTTMYTVPAPTSSGAASPSGSAASVAEYTGAGSQVRVGGALVAVVAGMGMYHHLPRCKTISNMCA